ncbi:MAG: ADP-ribose pyrophosphatase YjhB (NUDIX family) [Crocinitomicaceae bacterium]|jgi:ADP-ribose pyrophosphatase YjhB (NUDIX family)
MYKVFVDHKPVIFIEKKDSNAEFPTLKSNKINSFEKNVRKLLPKVTLDRPLQIICEDPKSVFKETFSDYLNIHAAGGLVKRKNAFLLIKRNGLWDIPKGKIDKGESVETAALREVEEECGIHGHKIVKPLCTTYHTMKTKKRLALKRTEWYYMSYSGSKTTTPQVKEGITKVKWMSEEHMLSIRGRTYGSINEVLDEYKKLYQV